MKKIFIGLFLAICLTLSVGMLLAGPSEVAANEQLREAPALKTETGLNGDYLEDLAGWVDDRFFLRRELISLDRWLTGNLLGTSGEDSVVLGKNGWLYYEPTVAGYAGVGAMTDRELQYAANNLELMADYCRENGKQFLFVIAPNKNSLYDENMPDYGVKAELSDGRRLYGLLEEAGVPYGDLFTEFEREPEVLYFAHDSHWNSRGAALGADVINAGFGVESHYFAGDFSQGTPHAGDLYAMLYPGFTDPETDPVYGGTLQYTFTGRATQPDAIRLQTAGQGSGKLLAYRDSFGNLLFPYLADSYGEATFSRSVTYDLTQEADYVLVELVERNLSYLITNVPTMPSPEAEIALPEGAKGTVTVTTAKRSGLLQVTGMLPEAADRAWLVCDGAAYQTFLLSGNGFAANVAQDARIQYIVYTIGDETRMYEITTGGN